MTTTNTTSPKTTAKHVAPGEAASKGRARASKAKVADNAAKVAKMNEAAAEPSRGELVSKALLLGVKGASAMNKAQLVAAIKAAEEGATSERPKHGDTPAKAAAKERVRKLTEARSGAGGNVPATADAPPASTVGRGRNFSERGVQARAEKRAHNNKRGPAARKLSDDELVKYCATVQREHPESGEKDELEYAYWIERLAVNRGRFGKAWAAAKAAA